MTQSTNSRDLLEGHLVEVNWDDPCDACGREFGASTFGVSVAVEDDEYVTIHEVCNDGPCALCGAPIHPSVTEIDASGRYVHGACPLAVTS